MAISTVRKKAIKDCVKSAVDRVRKLIELNFNKEAHHKSGRSGCHGKKYNIISTTILTKKNDPTYLVSTGCFQNDKEKMIAVSEFIKHSKLFHNRAKSINHK